jgi:hypothetical protein
MKHASLRFPFSKNGSVWLRVVLVSVAAVGAVGCRKESASSAPSVTLSAIPPAAQGGRERVDTISGTVSGAQPGQQIVVYARSGPWWVQPWPDKPFVPIKADSTWTTPTHLGFEYAALLVDPGYHPPPTLDTAPVAGGHILAVTVAKGAGNIQLAPTKPLKFGGYDWHVRTIASDRGGLNNLYDAENAWTDDQGALHLKINKRDGRWRCAEVVMNQSLGYGTYIAVVRNVAQLAPYAVLSMTTFDDWGGEEHFREMDVEMSRWGNAAAKANAQFAIQPFYIPGNLVKFTMPAGTLTNVLRWEPGRATFKTVRGSADSPGAPVIAEHTFTSRVPTPGKETYQFLFYVVAPEQNAAEVANEVVVEKFEYLP